MLAKTVTRIVKACCKLADYLTEDDRPQSLPDLPAASV